MRFPASIAAAALALLNACTSGASPLPDPATPGTSPPTVALVPSPTPTAPPVAFDTVRAVDTIRVLSGDIGPREATTGAYRRAAEHVEDAFRALGYTVRRQPLDVPSGVSWGVQVPAGETFNVIAEPPGFDSGDRHVVVGAHLDTVPQSPGANDNASGVAGVLELARLAAAAPPRVPVVFVAFAAEEPRGPGDDRHHYGSRAYVADMSRAERDALVGAISLDRIAYGAVIEVCTGGRGPRTLQRIALDRAEDLTYRARACTSRTSDHWPFERASLTGVRLGGIRNPGYHSPRDTLDEIAAPQFRRVGLLTWATITALR